MIEFSIHVEQDDEGFIVSDTLVMVYGVGKTLSEASQDYINSLHEYRNMVRDDKEILEKIEMIMWII